MRDIHAWIFSSGVIRRICSSVCWCSKAIPLSRQHSLRGISAPLRLLAIAAATMLLAATPCFAQEYAKKAIEKGLTYLVAHQHPDGYWIEVNGRKVNDEFQGRPGPHIAVTSLGCMALMASGAKPGEGPRGVALEKGLGWLLAQQKPEVGDFWVEGARMEDHALATRCIARAIAVSRTARLVESLDRAVTALVSGQNERGGWRYKWGGADCDLVVSSLCARALADAKAAGATIPEEPWLKVIDHLKLSAISDYPMADMVGGFWYQTFDRPFRHSRTDFALTAAGTAALVSLGAGDSSQAKAGLNFLLKKARWRPPAYRMAQSFDYFYAYHQAVEATRIASADDRDAFWAPVITDLVKGQLPDGRWEDLVGRNYATAMACLILQETTK